MAKFLVRDYTAKGYKEIDGPLARNRELSYVPWAITGDKRVVYAPTAEARGTPGNRGDDKGRLLPYDTQVSKTRRALCHSKLGVIALTKPEYSRPAVTKVSLGVNAFLQRRLQAERGSSDKKIRKNYAEKVGKYLFGTGYMSFGRFSDLTAIDRINQFREQFKEPKAEGEEAAQLAQNHIWNQSILALASGKQLATILSIHDGTGRLLLTPSDPEYGIFDKYAKLLRAESDGEMINPNWRGRKDKPKGEIQPTTLPGNITPQMAAYAVLPPLQNRNRGVDRYNRIAPNAPPNTPVRAETSGNIYYQQLELRNELFGAGPSGTTGTCLAAAFAFGKFDETSERMKEYLFAIIGYLVGGGMHSLHESLSILRLLKLEYNTGTLLGYDFSESPARTDAEGLVRGKVSAQFPLLPQKFLLSSDFQAWRDEYYDIVVLGGTHWMFNK
jgi:hypothetical protein